MEMGISIYPERSTFERDQEYLDLAKSLGFKRVFTSLLEITGDSEHVLSNFKKTISYASDNGMEVIVDINPTVLKQIGVKFDDISFFNDLGAYGIRLDMGFSGLEEAAITRNPYGIKLEVNMSFGTGYIDNLMSFSPKSSNLLGSHNFYPMRYTGLEEEFYNKCCKQFKNHNIKTSVFVTSQSGELGPWPLQDGLCTLEMHRNWSIETQVRHIMIGGMIDTIIIGNAYATKAELEGVARVCKEIQPSLEVELIDDISDTEKAVVLNEIHGYRGDISGYMIRSSLPRFKYKKHEIKPHNCKKIQRGDIVIGNENSGQYKGELHVALKEMENPERLNVVARLTEESMLLLPYIKPWSKFKLISNRN